MTATMKTAVTGEKGLEIREVPRPVRVFPPEEAEAAQAHMRANAHFGKILLRVAA
jgi:NADPH:quinone reductase-like Zn-dependent oxidoreductase